MEEKTINYLNTKWYYRFVKVAFILLSLLAVVIVLSVTFESSKPYQTFDNDKSYITCSNNVKYYLPSTGVSLYSSYLYSWDIDKLNTLCGSNTPLNLFNNQRFKLVSVYKDVGSWPEAIFSCLIAFLITFLTIEVIRRIFYYIVLGKVFPKK